MQLIILAAHGELAPALLNSAAMICGENPQVLAVSFLPGEDPDHLVAKYQGLISQYQPDEVLFLVDLFGGSPYNAAIRVAAGNANMDVVSGMNLPMVMETMMALEDTPTLSSLIDTALSTVSESVKTFSGRQLKTVMPTANVVADRRAGRPTSGNMKIPLLRIDSRLIHGQVATSWAKAVKCDAIFAISDEVAADDMRRRLLLQVAPPHLQSYVITVDKAIKVWKNPMYADRNVLWLVTKPADIVRLIEGGVDIKEVNVGGMTHREGCKLISQAVAVDADDVAAFKKLDEMGVKMTLQQLASTAPEPLMPKLANIQF